MNIMRLLMGTVVLSCLLISNEVFAKNFLLENYELTTIDVPYSFYALHCEEGNPPQKYFYYLKRLVGLATEYNVPLTIMFNPSWVFYILANPARINLVHSWQDNGHEIGLHHHGPTHRGWNGYSNMPKRLAEAVHKEKYPESKEIYKGTMDHYFSKLLELAYPYEVKSGTVTDRWTDMPPEQIYDVGGRTDGRTSKAVKNIFNNHLTYRINIRAGYLDETSRIEEYNSLEFDEIYGVVGHVRNFAEHPKVLEQWFSFLYESDPEGIKRKPVTNIMEDYILPNNLVYNKRCGNTICDSREKRRHLCPEDCAGCSKIYKHCEVGDSTLIYLMGK